MHIIVHVNVFEVYNFYAHACTFIIIKLRRGESRAALACNCIAIARRERARVRIRTARDRESFRIFIVII